ncbi:MAG: MFS transporter [Chloroflexi bacterium]|nr:MAG: MFS transporter [Chloroflexota bacterium]TME86392.1 MAG: MFS transporter [Chloroflexota bacterium]
MRRLLRDAMPLRRGEWGLALFLYFLLTVMVGADWVGKLGADALFVKRYGVQNVPFMYVITPIAMLAVSALIFFFIDRMRRRTMLLVYVLAVTLASVAIQYAITTDAIGNIVQPISYVFAHGVKETIYILFWVYAGNLYDSEQSRRLFPFFAGSVLVGKIIGGFVGAAIAPLIHAENFIGAQAVGFFVCFVALVLYRGLPEGRSGHVEIKDRPQGVRATFRESVDGYRAVTSDSLLRTFGVGVFFWYFLMQFANFLYLLGLDQSSVLVPTSVGREDFFAQLYASVYTSSSLVALAIQSFITSGLLRRIGIAWVLFFLPLWFVGTYAAAAWFNLNLVTGVALQLGERIWIPALHRPASELVYSQVSAAIRPRARAFLSGGVNAFGNMVAAVALIVGLRYSDVQTLLATGTGLSLVYLYNAWHTRRLFGRRIAQNLTSPDPDLRRNAADMLASESSAVPEDVLRSLGGRVPADVEHGVRLALTRRGILAVAADVTD